MLIIAALNLPYTATFQRESYSDAATASTTSAAAVSTDSPSLVNSAKSNAGDSAHVPFDLEPEHTENTVPEDFTQILKSRPVKTSSSEAEVNILMTQLKNTAFQSGLKGVSPGDYDAIYESERLATRENQGNGTFSQRRSRILRRLSSSYHGIDPDFSIEVNMNSNRGLYNALDSAYSRKLIPGCKYAGLTGLNTDAMSDTLKDTIAEGLLDKQCYPAFVSDKDKNGHYEHYCKQFLWPTFHCEIPDIPSGRHYEGYSWDSYVAVNRAIANKVIEAYEEGDIVWVHDYHLMLVPQMVRQKFPLAPIGFFMHVAFPSSEVFRCLAYRAELLNGVLAANMVAFHIPEYAHHFKMSLARILAVDITGPGVVETENHNTFILAYPMGIDTYNLGKIINLPDPESPVQQHRRVIRQRWPTQRIIAARDKLDPIRGLKQKMKAFDQFLTQNPEWASKVVLVQICTGANDNPDISLDSLVDQINSKHGDVASAVQPVVLLKQDVKFEQYLALLSEADGFCVSCLRDGMNLTCHEFVECSGRDRMGSLILSEFTGSASVFHDGALMINPWNQNQLAQAFKTCLEMTGEEKERRWRLLRAEVSKNPSYQWADVLTNRITVSWQDEISLQCLDPDVEQLQRLYHTPGDGKRLFFIELERPTSDEAKKVAQKLSGKYYELPGHDTTKPLADRTMSPVPVPVGGPYFSTRLSIINELMADKRNVVYIVSAESKKHMETMYRSIDGIGLIAELGKHVKLAGNATSDKRSGTWYSLPDQRNSEEWHEAMQPWVNTLRDRSMVASVRRTESTITVEFNISDDPEMKNRDLTMIGEYLSLINDHYARAFGVKTRHEGDTITLFRGDIGAFKEHAYNFVLQESQKTYDLLFLASHHLSPESDDSLFTWADKQSGTTAKELVKILIGGLCAKAQYKVEGANALLSLIQTMLTKEEPREISSRSVSRRTRSSRASLY